MIDATALFSDGKGYERLMGRWSRLVGEDFLAWLDAPKGVDWLDVGCGNGAFTEEIVARCAPARVTAIDPSEGQLAFARTRPGTAMVNFQNAGAQELPFPSASFDVAVMALVISFVPDPAHAVIELARVVRPGGIVATYMWDLTAGGTPVNPVVEAMKSLGLDPPLPPRSEASRSDVLHNLWEGAGLESIEARPISITVAFSSFDEFWESSSLPVGPLGKAIEGMSTDAKEQLRLRLRQHVPIAADGSIAFESRANAIAGRVPKTA
jgi:SAM-dependent methyltransferase